MRQARMLREKRDLSLEAVAAETGINYSHLARFEMGKAGLSIDKLVALANFYSVAIDALLAEVEPAPQEAG